MTTHRINLKNNAPTTYTNFDFASMCVFNGAIIAAGSAGLLQIGTGDTDNGVEIDAYFTPHTSNLGDTGKKRIRFVYLSMQCAGSMTAELTPDGKAAVGPYNLDALVSEGDQRRRVEFGRGTKFHYGKIKFANVDGASFSVDRIDALVHYDRHGVK